MKRWLGLFGLLALAAVPAILTVWHRNAPERQRQRFEQIQMGMSYAEVVERMGPESSREQADDWLQVSGTCLYWPRQGNGGQSRGLFFRTYVVVIDDEERVIMKIPLTLSAQR